MAVTAHRRLIFDGNMLRREVVVQAPSEDTRFLPASLGLVGLLAVLTAAWGGIAPLIGPRFGFRANSSGAWDWSNVHLALAVAPGAVGILAGLMMVVGAPAAVHGGGKLAISFAGLVALVCGAWFVIGPMAWSVIHSGSTPYFLARPPLADLANQVGLSFGPGLLLATFGGFAMGWAARHQRQVITTVPISTATDSSLVEEIPFDPATAMATDVPVRPATVVVSSPSLGGHAEMPSQ